MFVRNRIGHEIEKNINGNFEKYHEIYKAKIEEIEKVIEFYK